MFYFSRNNPKETVLISKMPHSSDPKLIVPFATEGDPLRQTVDHGERERRKKILGNYTSVESFLWSGDLSGHGLCEFNGGAG